MHVALLTESRYVEPRPGSAYVENIFAEDALVAAGLRRLDVAATRVDWADPQVNWDRFDAAVFRTTWDYFHRFGEFMAWLQRVEDRVRLLNPASLVRWNVDKHYLEDLAGAGVRVVPTAFVDRGMSVSVSELMRERDWSRAVLKPAVSGAGRHTHAFDLDEADRYQPLADRLLRDEAVMLQPFLPDVVERGEVTLVLLDGRCSHAVLKRAKPGDFRVQDDFGGTVHHHAPSSDEIAFAERVFSACEPTPVYGRVDLVRDEEGALVVMELELIEPELWFRFHPPAADLFAAAVRAQIG